MRVCLLFLALCLYAQDTYAQQVNVNDFQQLNERRILTNRRGMTVLSGWGAANLVAGGVGYFAANDEQWKAFHGMNAIWGAVNLGIGVLGYAGSRREQREQLSCSQMLGHYEAGRRTYLLNAGLDVAYIGTGALLCAYADRQTSPATCRGFGQGIALQGIFLLVFDGTMLTLHGSQNKKWYRLLEGVCVTGNGVGFRYTL